MSLVSVATGWSEPRDSKQPHATPAERQCVGMHELPSVRSFQLHHRACRRAGLHARTSHAARPLPRPGLQVITCGPGPTAPAECRKRKSTSRVKSSLVGCEACTAWYSATVVCTFVTFLLLQSTVHNIHRSNERPAGVNADCCAVIRVCTVGYYLARAHVLHGKSAVYQTRALHATGDYFRGVF